MLLVFFARFHARRLNLTVELMSPLTPKVVRSVMSDFHKAQQAAYALAIKRVSCLLLWGVLALVIAAQSGCGLPADIPGPGVRLYCESALDGTRWVYDTSTIRNVRIVVGGPRTFDYVDTEGRARHASSEDNVLIRCRAVNP